MTDNSSPRTLDSKFSISDNGHITFTAFYVVSLSISRFILHVYHTSWRES